MFFGSRGRGGACRTSEVVGVSEGVGGFGSVVGEGGGHTCAQMLGEGWGAVIVGVGVGVWVGLGELLGLLVLMIHVLQICSRNSVTKGSSC